MRLIDTRRIGIYQVPLCSDIQAPAWRANKYYAVLTFSDRYAAKTERHETTKY